MKLTFQIIILLSLICTLAAEAQNQALRNRLLSKQQQVNQAHATPQISVRAKMFDLEQAHNMDNTSWMRIIYRFADIDKGNNAALIYPIHPYGNELNLYTLIFKMMAEGKLTAYEYLDRRESFTDEFKVNFRDVLEKLNIPFQYDGFRYSFSDNDIPTNDVIGYYIKEGWYLDNTTSVVKTKIIAICPILRLYDDYGIGVARLPQFWIPYEDIRPYTMLINIMVSENNNAINYSLNDFFVMRLYQGEIYKVGNMLDKVLAEVYNTPNELKVAQNRIEQDLKHFQQHLSAKDSISLPKKAVKRFEKNKRSNKHKLHTPSKNVENKYSR